MSEGSEYVKIRFALHQDEDGYPPFGSEGVWAVPTDSGTFRIANSSWFARGVTEGDVVTARLDEDGQWWVVARVEESGNCTIQVIPLPDGGLAGSEEAVLDAFEPLGVTGESFGGQLRIVALTVPTDADLGAVKRRLELGEADGLWGWQEGSVTADWLAL